VIARLLVVLCALAPAAAAAQTVEGSFRRSLTVSGQADIEVETGSGRIEVRQGPAGQVEINGRIRASNSWGGWNRSRLSPEERVRRIEASPPIQQAGSVIRVGHIEDEELRNGVSVSYTLTIPANSKLVSKTGSGSQLIEGVRGQVQSTAGSGSIVAREVGALSASTGSGSITADRVEGSFRASTGSGAIEATGVTGAITAKTGSGGIDVAQTGDGNVDVSSSSGTVNVRGVRGALRGSTTSGGLHVQGEPRGEWLLETSSGGVRVDVPDGAGFELDARTSSGGIDVDMPVSVVGAIGRRSLRGSVRGGGPRLEVRTSSGSIKIR